MKFSGAEWIGDIPKEWSVTNVGSVYEERNEKVSDIDYEPLSVTMQGILPQLSSVVKSDDRNNRKLVKKGDFVINSRSDRRGALGVSDRDGSCSLINTVMTARKGIDPRFYNYVFQTPLFPDEYYKYGYGIVDDLWTTRWAQMKKILLPNPKEGERIKIVKLLDDYCNKIDAVIVSTKESIEEYRKLKHSIISHAIINGIDENEEKEEISVDWIGRIPLEWCVKTLGQLCIPVKNKNVGTQERNLLSLSYGNIVRKDINSTDGLIPENYEGYNIIENGDIVLRLTDLQNDHKSLRVGYVGERGIITSAYLTIRNLSSIPSKYIYYYLHSYDVAKGFYGMGSGIRQGLNWGELKTLKIALPSDPDEQKRIVNYLDEKCEYIDSLLINKEKFLKDMQLYKKTLIYMYVTGKRRVVQ